MDGIEFFATARDSGCTVYLFGNGLNVRYTFNVASMEAGRRVPLADMECEPYEQLVRDLQFWPNHGEGVSLQEIGYGLLLRFITHNAEGNEVEEMTLP